MHKLIFGCGYLGTCVAKRWLARGDSVTGIIRHAGREVELLRQGITPYVADVLNPESLRDIPAVGTVLYCISHDRRSGGSQRATCVDGLRNTLGQLHRDVDSGSQPPLFLYVSSTSVYGQTDGSWVDESAVTEPRSEAGRIILDAEALLHATKPWLPRSVVLRFAGIYGPGRLFGLQTLLAREPLEGDPERWLNVIHVEDGAAAVLAAEERSLQNAVYNVSDGEPRTRRAYYELLAQLAQVPTPEFSTKVSTPTMPVPMGRGDGNRRISNQRLRLELGWMPRHPSCDVGLASALAAALA